MFIFHLTYAQGGFEQDVNIQAMMENLIAQNCKDIEGGKFDRKDFQVTVKNFIQIFPGLLSCMDKLPNNDDNSTESRSELFKETVLQDKCKY